MVERAYEGMSRISQPPESVAIFPTGPHPGCPDTKKSRRRKLPFKKVRQKKFIAPGQAGAPCVRAPEKAVPFSLGGQQKFNDPAGLSLLKPLPRNLDFFAVFNSWEAAMNLITQQFWRAP